MVECHRRDARCLWGRQRRLVGLLPERALDAPLAEEDEDVVESMWIVMNTDPKAAQEGLDEGCTHHPASK